MRVSKETYNVIARALAFSLSVGDSFDMTIYPVLRAWGFTTGEYRIPGDDELAALLRCVDDGRVKLDPDECSVSLPKGFMLDLGAVAKGHAAERAAAILRENGVEHALLDLGSSTIRTVGNKPDGSKWSIAIRDPKDASAYAGAVLIGEGSVSTSGGYERCFIGEDGRIYGHLIDPTTGRPADNGVLSVTVLCEDAFAGDGLSTALYVMGPERAVDFWREKGGFEFVMITEDGILVTFGAKDAFTPLGSYTSADIRVIGNED